ncbi:MAG: hypothetical protein QOE61_3833, partial [Micromonosporaceae bacterium]|nr:hypothetical protein [Micromonosporaceae bacterium]
EPRSSEIESMQADGAFELLEINGEYDPSMPARIDPVTGQYPLSAWPMLASGRGALPFDAVDNPLYVFADYYGGYFLLSVKSGTSETITLHAESPQVFGRRIRAEIVRAGREPGEAPATRRPVVLLARHRSVPPQIAATVARELLNAADVVWTASMPVTAYVGGAGGDATTATLALVRLPGQAGDPFWTLIAPLGLSIRTEAPPLHREIKTYATATGGSLTSHKQAGTRFEQDPVDAVGRVTKQRAEAFPDGGTGLSLAGESVVWPPATSAAPAPKPFSVLGRRPVEEKQEERQAKPGRRAGQQDAARTAMQADDAGTDAPAPSLAVQAVDVDSREFAAAIGELSYQLYGDDEPIPLREVIGYLVTTGTILKVPALDELPRVVAALAGKNEREVGEAEVDATLRELAVLVAGAGQAQPGHGSLPGGAKGPPRAEPGSRAESRAGEPEVSGSRGWPRPLLGPDPVPGKADLATRAATLDVGALDNWWGKLRPGPELDTRMAQARKLVGRHHYLPLAFQTGPTSELTPLEQAIRRVTYYLHATGDRHGADDLAQQLTQDIAPQPSPPGLAIQPAAPLVSPYSASSDGERPAENIELSEISRRPGPPFGASVSATPPLPRRTPPHRAKPRRKEPALPAWQPAAAALPGPDRTFPPLFLEEFGGAIQYPMGHFGKVVKLGNVLLGDYHALAALVVEALPRGNESLHQALADQVESLLRDNGSQAFAQAILVGGVPFTVHPDSDPSRPARTVTVKLELGDPGTAHQVREPGIDPEPAGQQRSLPWDSEQIVSAASSRMVSSARGLSAGPAGLATGRAIPGVSVEATSTTSFTNTTSASAAERRFTASARTGVDYAFFRFPEGILTVQPKVPPGAAPGRRLPVVLGFPENLCPLQCWRPLSADKLGVTQDQVDRDEVVGYDRVRGRDVRAREAAQRIEKLLGRVAVGRESVAGLPRLRDAVWQRLTQEVSEAD